MIAFWVLIFGIAIGSFLNVVIIRGEKDESIVGGSHCVKCEHPLAWYDNIPLISYLLLGGKCRYCKEHISFQYPFVEAINGILYLLLYLRFGLSVEFFVFAIISSILIAISFEDAKIQYIEPKYNLAIAILNCIVMIINKSFLDSFWGAISVSGFMLIIILVTNGKGMGGGDMKLMAALGIGLGLKGIIISFYIGCIISVIVHPILMKFNVKGFDKKRFAFGPYLSIGAYISMLYGQQIANWFLALILNQ